MKERIDHGIPAELDHDGFPNEALDIGQCLGQDLGDVQSFCAIE
jgi:hypothetical protein